MILILLGGLGSISEVMGRMVGMEGGPSVGGRIGMMGLRGRLLRARAGTGSFMVPDGGGGMACDEAEDEDDDDIKAFSVVLLVGSSTDVGLKDWKTEPLFLISASKFES